MKNGERVLTDVGYVIRDWENGRINYVVAFRKLQELVNGKDTCKFCAYTREECDKDHEKTCYKGVGDWLRSDA